MEINYENMSLRGFYKNDIYWIPELANNNNISMNLRDVFPFPYRSRDAAEFISKCRKEKPQVTFVIEYESKPVGCIGLIPQEDIYRLGAEMGYWIGEKYWGKGIATKAVNLMVRYGFEKLGFIRIFAGVFCDNNASKRVLEKAGFSLECIAKNSVYKMETVKDEWRYVKLKSE